jgi:transcriptional regulator GlxA family with amidase domain
MDAAVIVFEGVDELDAVGPYEVLANAAVAVPELRVELVTLAPSERVTGSHGLVLQPRGILGDQRDLVVVPGGGWNDRAAAGAYAETVRGELPRALARLHGGGAVLASVCTGAMILAAAGLLRDRPVTTHHRAHADLRDAGARVVEARVVDDGDIVTAGGVTSGIDLGLWIVERWWGRGLADAIAGEMEHQRVLPAAISRSAGAGRTPSSPDR